MTDTGGGARVRQLDTLRGVAAMLVFALHAGQFYSWSAPPVAALKAFEQWIDLGRTGIVVFFLISGFVMPGSFSGTGPRAAKQFVRRRFFRLYPAFWVSLAAAVCVGVFYTVSIDGPRPTLMRVLANATMLPSLFGQVHTVGVYWTLEIELAFYAMLLAIYWFRPLNADAAASIAFGLLGLGALYAVAARPLGISDHAPLNDRNFQGFIHLSLMFGGAALRFHWEKRTDPSRVFLTAPLLTKVYFAAWFAVLAGGGGVQVLREGFGPQALHSSLSYLSAIVLFLAVLRFGKGGPVGSFLGDRSYSLYLFHSIVLVTLAETLRRFPESPLQYFAVYAAVGLAFAMLVAHVVYEWVEKPAIAYGRGVRDARTGATATIKF